MTGRGGGGGNGLEKKGVEVIETWRDRDSEKR